MSMAASKSRSYNHRQKIRVAHNQQRMVRLLEKMSCQLECICARLKSSRASAEILRSIGQVNPILYTQTNKLEIKKVRLGI